MAAVTVAGRAMPATATLLWLGTFLFGTLLLTAWAVLFARALVRRLKVTPGRALYLAAICHLPLAAGLLLIRAVYSDDAVNYLYSASAQGRVVYRPLVLAAMVAVPSSLQLAVAALVSPQKAIRYLSVLAPVGVALGLRLWSLNWQLPFTLHSDELNYLNPAMIGWAHGDMNPHRFANPTVMFYLDIGVFRLFGGDRAQDFRVLAEALGQQVSDPRGWYLVILAARGLVALLGAGTVLLVYLAAKELFDRRTGLLAAWALALAFLHVRNSHYATNDVSATFFATASFLFAAKLYHKGRWRDYLWAGILGGLATSTKYNAGIFVFPILAAHLARHDGKTRLPLLSPAGLAPLVAAYGMSALAFILGTPYSILDWPTFTSGFREQLGMGSAPWFGQAALPTWWMYLTTLVQGFGLLPLLAALLGIVCLVRSRRWPLALVTAFPLAYYGFMSSQQLFFARFAVPMLPFLAILAGYGMLRVAEGFHSVRFGNPLFAVFLVAVLAQPVAYSLQSDLINARADTRMQADRWVTDSVPNNALLFVDKASELQPYHGWPSKAGLPVRWYRQGVDPAPWEQETQRPLFVAITSFGYDGVRRGIGDTSVLPDEYKALEQQGKLVALFAAGPNNIQLPYAQDEVYTPFWYLFQRERPGPTVRIYRFD